jgi:hypothetical protein
MSPTFLAPKQSSFAQIIIGVFNGKSIWETCAKIWRSVKKLQPKKCSKISAQMLVYQKSIFGTIYFTLVPLHTAQIGW